MLRDEAEFLQKQIRNCLVINSPKKDVSTSNYTLRVDSSASMHQKHVPFKNNSKCSSSRKVETLHNGLENFDINREQKYQVDVEVDKILRKGAIVDCPQSLEVEFLSNLFLVGKKDDSFSLVINLKNLNHLLLISTSKWKDCSASKLCFKKEVTFAN